MFGIHYNCDHGVDSVAWFLYFSSNKTFVLLMAYAFSTFDNIPSENVHSASGIITVDGQGLIVTDVEIELLAVDFAVRIDVL